MLGRFITNYSCKGLIDKLWHIVITVPAIMTDIHTLKVPLCRVGSTYWHDTIHWWTRRWQCLELSDTSVSWTYRWLKNSWYICTKCSITNLNTFVSRAYVSQTFLTHLYKGSVTWEFLTYLYEICILKSKRISPTQIRKLHHLLTWSECVCVCVCVCIFYS